MLTSVMNDVRGSLSAATSRARTVAVMTAFNPDNSLIAVAESVVAQCQRLIIVDNTPPGKKGALDVIGERDGVTILRSSHNVGLAAALTRGISQSGDAEFVFLLDQDSAPPASMVESLTGLLDADRSRGAAGPAPWDENAHRYLDPRTSARPQVAEMPVIITSAMLLRRTAYNSTKGMREDFFVDCVDQDLCLQIRREGWSIVQDKSLLLPHSLGEATWHGRGWLRLRATHHPTWRLYWIARNGIMLSVENAPFDPRWALTNMLILGYWFLTVALFEPPRLARLGALTRGSIDGLFRRRSDRYLPEQPS
jgi:rhamnosyltransferase